MGAGDVDGGHGRGVSAQRHERPIHSESSELRRVRVPRAPFIHIRLRLSTDSGPLSTLGLIPGG